MTTDTTSPTSVRRPVLDSMILAVIVLLASGLRLFRLDYQSLWGDEVFSVTVSRLPFDEMTSALIADFVHPPLHYYVLGLWFEVVGYSAFQARLVAAIFGILAVVSIYYLARYLYDTRTAQLSTLLLAISQLSVWYAQETRPYSQVLFFQ